MSAQHTRGPWKGVVATVDGRMHIAVAPVTPSEDRPLLVVAMTGPAGAADEAESIANAYRIVQCVNACEGVPNEVLDARAAGGLPWSVADQIDRRVRAGALLQALRQISLCSQNSASSKEECGRIARDAIAAIKGDAT